MGLIWRSEIKLETQKEPNQTLTRTFCVCFGILWCSSFYAHSGLSVNKRNWTREIQWNFFEDRKSGHNKPHRYQRIDNRPRGMRNGLRMNWNYFTTFSCFLPFVWFASTFAFRSLFYCFYSFFVHNLCSSWTQLQA